MKALFFLFFLPFFLSVSAFSQTPDSLAGSRFVPYSSAGILGGINISSLNNYNYNNSRLGLLVALTGEYRFSELLGLAAELAYSQQGTRHQHTEFGLNYLKFPVMLTLHDHNFMVQAGAYGAALLKARAFYGKFTEDVTGHFKPAESGLCLGIAFHFSGRTSMGARFYRGFQNVNKTLPDSPVNFVNSTLQLTGGYTF